MEMKCIFNLKPDTSFPEGNPPAHFYFMPCLQDILYVLYFEFAKQIWIITTIVKEWQLIIETCLIFNLLLGNVTDYFVSIIKCSYICTCIWFWIYICIYAHLIWEYIKIISLSFVCGHMRRALMKQGSEHRCTDVQCHLVVVFVFYVCC